MSGPYWYAAELWGAGAGSFGGPPSQMRQLNCWISVRPARRCENVPTSMHATWVRNRVAQFYMRAFVRARANRMQPARAAFPHQDASAEQRPSIQRGLQGSPGERIGDSSLSRLIAQATVPESLRPTARWSSPTWLASASPAACSAIANDPTHRPGPPPMPQRRSSVAPEEYSESAGLPAR